jgi:hypothetical protein
MFSRSYKYVSDTQVKAWLGCVVANSRGGSLLLVASNPGKPHFALVAAWAPQRGVGTGDLIVTAAGASFDAPNGPKRITRELRGPSDTSMIIYPDEQAERIDITADIAGATAEPFHVKLERPEKTGTIPLVLYNNFLPDRGGYVSYPSKDSTHIIVPPFPVEDIRRVITPSCTGNCGALKQFQKIDFKKKDSKTLELTLTGASGQATVGIDVLILYR